MIGIKGRARFEPESWILTGIDKDKPKFQNVVLDMDPSTIKNHKGSLKIESVTHRIQPFLDIDISRVPLDGTSQLTFGRLLKCSVCKIFPKPKEYYFCCNKNEPHLLCKACFGDDLTPTCTTYIRNNSHGASKMEKCGMELFLADDPLYDLLLRQSIFYCVYKKFGCCWTGLVDAIHQHADQCEYSSFFRRDQIALCPFSDCKMKAKTNVQLIRHLKEFHETAAITKSVPLTSVSLKWAENFKDRVWVPAMLIFPGFDLLLAVELKNGKLRQWFYVIESQSNAVKSFRISSGFRDTQSHTVLSKATPQLLELKPDRINRKKKCLSINIKDFVKNHLVGNRTNGGRNFILDVKIM